MTHLLHYLAWCVVCLLWAQANHLPQHISHKRDCKYKRSIFQLAHCFQKGQETSCNTSEYCYWKRRVVWVGRKLFKRTYYERLVQIHESETIVWLNWEVYCALCFFLTSQSYFCYYYFILSWFDEFNAPNRFSERRAWEKILAAGKGLISQQLNLLWEEGSVEFFSQKAPTPDQIKQNSLTLCSFSGKSGLVV